MKKSKQMIIFKTVTPTEADYQVALFQWVNFKIQQGDERYKLIFHVPNGGSRHKLEAINLKRQGVKAGVSDVFVDIPSGSAHGLRIEMKSAKGKVSPAQEEFLQLEAKYGYLTAVCYSADEAIKTIEEYLG